MFMAVSPLLLQSIHLDRHANILSIFGIHWCHSGLKATRQKWAIELSIWITMAASLSAPSCIIEHSVAWEEVVLLNITVFTYFNHIFTLILNLVDNFPFASSLCMMNDITFPSLVLCFCEDVQSPLLKAFSVMLQMN